MSSESDELRYAPRLFRSQTNYADSSDSYEGMMADPVNKLASNLQETTRNLRSLDHMLGTYRDVGREQRTAIDKLRSGLDKTQDVLKEERLRSSMLSSRSLRASDLEGPEGDHTRRQGTYSDYTAHSDEESPSRRRKKKSGSVRFADDMNRELHEVHQSIRDLSHDHSKLEESFTKELDRRDRDDVDARKSLRDMMDVFKRQPPQADPSAFSVDRRLEALQNELQTERRLMDRRFDEVGSISSDLKQALHSQQHAPPPPAQPAQPAQEDWKLKSQYLQSEAVKHRLESELDHVKRKLDHSEGSKSALQQQIEDMKTQLSRGEQERSKIKSQLDESRVEDDVRDRRKRKSLEDDKDRERQRYHAEINELRTQLSKTLSATNEVEELRRTIDRSERQRAQLSDHIEVLTKDMENRERQNAKLISQLKETSDKYEEGDRHKTQLITQLEDALQRLKDFTREVERLSNELRVTQQNLAESERKKEEFKGRAQETVRQWKMKCKQLERDSDRYKHSGEQVMHRNEQIIKEMENFKNHGNAASMQLENLRREMGDILAVRAAQDEQLRLKDVEVNELKSQRMDLDRECRDSRTIADKLENELHNADNRLSSVLEEKARLEDQLSSVQASQLLSQDQVQQIQREFKEVQLLKADLAAQLGEANVRKQELKMCLGESQHKDRTAQEDVETLRRQVKEERESHQAVLESLKKELAEIKTREQQVVQEIARRYKKEQVEYEVELQALRMELNEQRSAMKLARRQDENLKTELARLHDEIQRYEEENSMLLRKVDRTKLEFHTQTQMAEDDLDRVKLLEDELYKNKNSVRRLEQENLNLLNELSVDVDAALDMASIESPEKYQAMNNLKGSVSGPSQVLAELKCKIQWIKEEFRDRMKREKKLRKDFRDALSSTDYDREYFLNELSRRDDALEELSNVKKELILRENENVNCVETLQDQILDLTDQLELQKIREEQQARVFTEERQHVIEDIQETQRDREKIQERYLRLQETMKLLQDDLRETRLESYKSSEDLRISSPKLTPMKKHRVRIMESPVRSKSPCRSPDRGRSRSPHRSPDRGCQTPPPLALTDDEFKKRFLPKTPEVEHGIL